MLAMTRKTMIKEMILEHKSVTVSELARKFSVTEETIRRDLKVMEEAGFLIRTYGGAYIQDGVQNEIDIAVRETACVENKIRIAQTCAKLIHNGDSIFLDCSTTAFFICEQVKNMRITVLTNSLKVANFFAIYSNIHLIMMGGIFNNVNMSFVGKITTNALGDFYVDKAFISCRTLSIEHGVTDSNEQDADIRQMMLRRANEVYVIADYTKFNKTSFISVDNFENVDVVITDQPLDGRWHQFFEERKIKCFD
ncbi:DeoR/GlpR family DNA-binding transcription regulator [Oscillospiraceae bacterium PP1C4]